MVGLVKVCERERAEMTYDPILQSRELPRLRLLNPLKPPAPGTALVLIPDSGEPDIIYSGTPLSNARFGGYRYMFLVDIGLHHLTLEMSLLSKDPAFAFLGQVSLTCQVIDPAQIVIRKIHDVGESVYGPIKRILRGIARIYDIAEAHQAERALNMAVDSFTGDAAIRLRNLSVELKFDEDDAGGAHEVIRALRESRLESMQLNHQLEMTRGALDPLMALLLEKEGPRAVLEFLADAKSSERSELLRALRILIERTDPTIETFRFHQAERLILDRLLASRSSAGNLDASRPAITTNTAHQISGFIYLDKDDTEVIQRVEDSVADIMDFLGYTETDVHEPEHGSFIRRFTAKARNALTDPELVSRRVKLERALELHTVDSKQAEVDATAAKAFAELMTALKDVSSACVRVGSIFVVKYENDGKPVVLTRTLSQLEIQTLEKYPEIQKEPYNAFEALGMAVDRFTAESPELE